MERGDGEKLYYKTGGKWGEGTSDAVEFTTGNDPTTDKNLGNGIALLNDLPVDGTITYFLEESKAPDGYNKLTEPIAFKVRANGTVGLVDDKGNDSQVANDKVQIVFNDPYYTIVVNDDPGTVLPETGGPGTNMFMILSLLFLATGGALLGIRARKRGDFIS